ncbi:hypothetical protein EYF80_024676 [Liparis tanakae]|uniref:Uncharacterized protein n=1 Tax=Liparis tanakae TaxID=230148 RepID=A0A4Z2HGT4_9TELE|nr:hypothetical protein EYF80_024676 [Liparis tanakae]
MDLFHGHWGLRQHMLELTYAHTCAVANSFVLDNVFMLEGFEDLDFPLEVPEVLGGAVLELLHGHHLPRAVLQRVVAAHLHAAEVTLKGGAHLLEEDEVALLKLGGLLALGGPGEAGAPRPVGHHVALHQQLVVCNATRRQVLFYKNDVIKPSSRRCVRRMGNGRLRVHFLTPTGGEEAVEVSDNGPEGGPVRRLIVHAAVNQVGQLGPLGSRQLVPVLVEQLLLQRKRAKSRVLSGLSPPLQISHSVVPKPHLSLAKLMFWGFSMHSGGTHGIRSTRTDERRRHRSTERDGKQIHMT